MTPTMPRFVDPFPAQGFLQLIYQKALRILALLEDHHRRLASLIKEPPRKKDKACQSTRPSSESSPSSPPPKSTTAQPASASAAASSLTPPSARRRLPQSSIASNLAEARGIQGPRRGTPSNASVSATNALAARNDQPSTPVRDLLSRKAEANKRNESQSSPKQDEKPISAVQNATTPPTEDNFRRFYSAFEGVISAISAPLAFTSLPLNPTPPTPAVEASPKEPKPAKSKSRNQSPEASRTVKSSQPDLSALISKPALAALREQKISSFGPFVNNESFYLVPTSGGTVSYASILQNPNEPHHPHHAAQNPHLDSIDEMDNESGLRGSSHEEFVDAHETVGPPSPTSRRRPRGTTTGVTAVRTIPAGRGSGLKTMEELSLENETLKQLVDKQSKRLSMWETTSQSSYSALAQSFRARKMPSDPTALAQALAMGSNAVAPALPSPPAAAAAAASPPALYQHHQPQPQPQPDPEYAKRIAELEAQLKAQTSQINHLSSTNEQLTRQNEKNGQVLGRYREQWEKLKAGARKKEQERVAKRKAEVHVDTQQASGAAAMDAKDKDKDKDKGSEDADEEQVLEGDEAPFGKA